MGKKKKIIIPIAVVSSIGLLLGGLIYLGISTFPELLESEEELAAKEAKAADPVAPIEKHTIIVEDFIDDVAPAETTAIVFGGFGSFFGSQEYLSDLVISDEIGESKSTGNIIISDSVMLDFVPSFIEEVISDDVIEETYFEEPAAIQEEEVSLIEDSLFYESSASNDNYEPVKITKTNKRAKAKSNPTRSNEAVVETSLLVIGAVDVLSMILIKRKKNIFR